MIYKEGLARRGTVNSLRVGQRVFVNRFFAESKICELDMAFGVQEDVLGFQIPVDNALTVQMLQRQRDLGNVKTSLKIKIKVVL